MQNAIQRILSAKKMTQAQLAERVGIKREYLNKIINSHINPTINLAIKIGQALDMPVEKIFSSMEINRRQNYIIENQDKIIEFMLKEELNITDLFDAVYLNEHLFMNRLLEKSKQIKYGS
jgi:DNA-binding XRE family transcriptional regulator